MRRGTEKTTVFQRCTCWAINLDAQDFWEDRNSRRREQTAQNRAARRKPRSSTPGGEEATIATTAACSGRVPVC
jgi:hypothetical protein